MTYLIQQILPFSFENRAPPYDSSFLQIIYSGDIPSITSFLNRSKGINEKELNTAIEYSIFENKESLLKILLGYKTASDLKSLEKQTQELPYFYLKTLLPPINFFLGKNKKNIELLAHKAAFEGNLQKLRNCTKYQINDPDISNLDPSLAILKGVTGMTPLHYAALGGHLEAVKFLVSTGISLQTKDIEGHSILHFAVLSRSTDLLNYLIQKSPLLLNQGNFKGETPLHFAATQKDYGIIKYLIKSGADPLKKDLKGVGSLTVLWKMIETRDPLNINLVELIPAILFLARLLIISYPFFNQGPESLTTEFQKHLSLMALDRYSLLTNICMFFWNISGLDSSDIAIQPLSIYEAACGSIPAFKNLKACWANKESRDVKKIIASALVNTAGLIQTISAVYRTVTSFHLNALLEIINRRDQAFAEEFSRQFKNFSRNWGNIPNADTDSAIIKTHMKLTPSDLEKICFNEDPSRLLNRKFRSWALSNHPDKKPSGDSSIFAEVSTSIKNLKSSPSKIKEGVLCSDYL